MHFRCKDKWQMARHKTEADKIQCYEPEAAAGADMHAHNRKSQPSRLTIRYAHFHTGKFLSQVSSRDA